LFRAEIASLKQGEEIEVFYDYYMAKAEEDTEIYHTAMPTDGLTITIVDTYPGKRAVRARTVHRAPLRNNSSSFVTGTYSFTLDEYLLPQQGFVIWWKNYPRQPVIDGSPTMGALEAPGSQGG
jgi:hypothetical protein